MSKYKVIVPEVYDHCYETEADSYEEALVKVLEHDCDFMWAQWTRPLEEENFTVTDGDESKELNIRQVMKILRIKEETKSDVESSGDCN